MIENLLVILVTLVIVVVIGYVAKYVIDSFFPAQLQMPLLVLVGLILLILLVYVIAGRVGLIGIR